MTLPTIQPVDWPDWGAIPTFSYANLSKLAIGVLPNTIAEIPAGYYNYVTLVFVADGDGNHHEYTLDWMDAAASEGGSVIATRKVIRRFGYTVIVPMSAWAPVLRVQLTDSTAVPTSVIVYRSLQSSYPQNVGYPGGDMVATVNDVVAATDSLVIVPSGCVPSEHQLTFSTDAIDWAVVLQQWTTIDNSINLTLYTSTAIAPFNFRFIPPDGSWNLIFQNNDVTQCNLALVLNRLP